MTEPRNKCTRASGNSLSQVGVRPVLRNLGRGGEAEDRSPNKRRIMMGVLMRNLPSQPVEILHLVIAGHKRHLIRRRCATWLQFQLCSTVISVTTTSALRPRRPGLGIINDFPDRSSLLGLVASKSQTEHAIWKESLPSAPPMWTCIGEFSNITSCA